jgi:hypothetical protein
MTGYNNPARTRTLNLRAGQRCSSSTAGLVAGTKARIDAFVHDATMQIGRKSWQNECSKE